MILSTVDLKLEEGSPFPKNSVEGGTGIWQGFIKLIGHSCLTVAQDKLSKI